MIHINSPELFIADGWQEYELIDCGDGERLERWGETLVIRPDPQALWPKSDYDAWEFPNAIYHRSSKGGGEWEYLSETPSDWNMRYKDLTFKVKLTGFKHTGLFPEQAYNWDKARSIIERANGTPRVLNLFGYTGAATIAAAKSGANVCHVDSAKGILTWCNENAALSKIPHDNLRLIQDDCLKFVQREARRGNKYDAIIMDPPSFGRGAKGEVWKFEDNLWELLKTCKNILSDEPLFFLVNSYTAGISSLVVANMLASLNLPFSKLTYGELVLPFREGRMLLPAGLTVWLEND